MVSGEHVCEMFEDLMLLESVSMAYIISRSEQDI